MIIKTFYSKIQIIVKISTNNQNIISGRQQFSSTLLDVHVRTKNNKDVLSNNKNHCENTYEQYKDQISSTQIPKYFYQCTCKYFKNIVQISIKI